MGEKIINDLLDLGATAICAKDKDAVVRIVSAISVLTDVDTAAVIAAVVKRHTVRHQFADSVLEDIEHL